MKRTVFFIATILVLSLSSLVNAQEREWQEGDRVMIRKEVTHYLTGEEPSKWVYFVEQQVQQVGGKRFPDGVLMRGILSWVGKDDLILIDSDEGVEEMQKRAEEIEQMSDADKAALQKYAESKGTTQLSIDSTLMAEREKMRRQLLDSLSAVQQAREDSLRALQQAREDSIAAEQARQLQQMKAREDSIAAALAAAQESLQALKGDTAQSDTTQRQSAKQPMHRLSVGVRGGMASLMHDADPMGKWRVGGDVVLDLQYAYYFGFKEGSRINPGILTGLSFGWAKSSIQSPIDTTYTVSTSDGDINYSISAEKVAEADRQLQLEIPLMFSMLTDFGLWLNVGPRFQIPVHSPYSQTIISPSINAYFPEEGVTVSDEVITGKVQNDQLTTSGKYRHSKFNLLLSAEIGYEWQLAPQHALGVGLYGNVAVVDAYKNQTQNNSLINVTAPDGATPADVNIEAATDTYAKGMGYFDFGLKLVYSFNLLK